MPEAIEAVGRMLSGYTQRASSDAYVGTIAALLMQYPRGVALRCADPLKGVATKSEFLPTVAVIVKWCEADHGFMARVVEHDRRSREQLDERDRQERKAESVEHRARVVERVRQEMMAAGMPLEADRQHYHGETPATVKAKYGISDEQWDAMEDGPKSQWQRATGG